MLKVKCPHCGTAHKKQDIAVTPTLLTDGKITYKYYQMPCMRCGNQLDWDRYAKKNIANKARAIKNYNETHKKPYQDANANRYVKPTIMSDTSARALIVMILAQAAFDSQDPKHKKEVEVFWDSEWCAELCSALGRNPKDAKENCKNGGFADFYKTLIQ